jgi:hypothetical protein
MWMVLVCELSQPGPRTVVKALQARAFLGGDDHRNGLRHPRWTFHFTPTSGSWLNAVENFFSALTQKRLRRGVFRSIVDLQAAINRYLDEHKGNPKPFVWTKPARDILERLPRLPVPSV